MQTLDDVVLVTLTGDNRESWLNSSDDFREYFCYRIREEVANHVNVLNSATDLPDLTWEQISDYTAIGWIESADLGSMAISKLLDLNAFYEETLELVAA